MKKHLEKGRCTVLKELEKAQRSKQGKPWLGSNTFKDYLEATIMRHLQQTPKSPTISSAAPQLNPTIVSPHNTLSSILSQQPQAETSTSVLSMIQTSSRNDLIATMDTSPSVLTTLNFTASPDLISATSSSLISSYNNTASSICSDRNLQSVMPVMANQENHVPNDILYQFDTTTSCNSIDN